MAYKGRFKPKNKDKYRGDVTDITYRSLLERRFMVYCDTCEEIKSWSSETTIIPYFYPVTGRKHRYYVDFKIELDDGTYLIEVKPYVQTQPPKMGKAVTRKAKNRYAKAMVVYIKNQYKWKYALAYCLKRNMNFKVLTDVDIKKKTCQQEMTEELKNDNLKKYMTDVK